MEYSEFDKNPVVSGSNGLEPATIRFRNTICFKVRDNNENK